MLLSLSVIIFVKFVPRKDLVRTHNASSKKRTAPSFVGTIKKQLHGVEVSNSEAK